MSANNSYEAMMVFSVKNGEEGVPALIEKFKALIEQNGIHFHDVNVGNCFNIHARKHKTQLHFLGGKSGASKTIDIHPAF